MANIKLFQPIHIGKLDLKNRVIMAPMCTNESRKKDGMVTDFHRVHYAARALGDVSLINIEATAVEEDGKISDMDLGLWNEEQAQAFTGLVQLLHRFGAKVAVQLGHAGRKARDAVRPIAPSKIAFNENYREPFEMTAKEIADVVEMFKVSAAYAARAGVDVIELHAAHGYLINQFLSPLSNVRTDQYGGSLENRYRFLREIIDQVKTVFSGSLWVRISANEYSPEGNSLDDFVQMGLWMKEQGVELLDISSGGVIDVYPDDIYDGYQVPLASEIRSRVGLPVSTVGLLNDPKLAEYVLQVGQADLICLGRPLLANPNWIQMAATVLQAGDTWKAYNRAYERGRIV